MTRPLSYAERCQLNELGFVRQSDGAERDAKLARVKRAIERTQRIVNAVHRTSWLNLCDVQTYLQYAVEAVESEAEE